MKESSACQNSGSARDPGRERANHKNTTIEKKFLQKKKKSSSINVKKKSAAQMQRERYIVQEGRGES